MENQNNAYIEQLNDKLHGRYPMTLKILVEEINKISIDYQQVSDRGDLIGPVKYYILAIAEWYKDKSSKEIYEFYCREVKPYILKQ